MIDAGDALTTAYFQLLANLSYEGNQVNVYPGMASDNAQAPYVIIGPWQPQSDNTKNSFGQKGEINLSVVTRFQGGLLSKRPARQIANQITQLLKPSVEAEVLNVEGFHCYGTVITATQELLPASETDKVYQVIISIAHLLQQI